jgi:CheY-like chemotaxis protein
MPRILLAQFEDGPARDLAQMFRQGHHDVVICPHAQPVLKYLEHDRNGYDLIVLDISQRPRNALMLVKHIKRLCLQYGPRPRVLCVSRTYPGPSVEFELEQEGARVVYV